MKIKKHFVNALLVMMTALFLCGSAHAKKITVASNKSFEATVTDAKKAIEGRGMMIVAEIDHQKMLSMVGANIKGAITLEFGKPDMAKMLMSKAPEAGLEMPGKIYVYEKGGKTYIAYYTPNFAQYGKMFAEMDKMMAMMLSEIAKEAAK